MVVGLCLVLGSGGLRWVFCVYGFFGFAGFSGFGFRLSFWVGC